jgi:hypothetical protein
MDRGWRRCSRLWRLHGLPGHLGSGFAEFLGLFGELLHLRLNEFGLQRNHVLRVFGVHEAVGKSEGAGDVAFGIAHRFFADILGSVLHRFGLPSKRETACWAAFMNVLNAARACSMLFSVMARSSAGTSKWGIPSLLLMELTLKLSDGPTEFELTDAAGAHPTRYSMLV